MDRKIIYAAMVLGYYTFLLIFSFLVGFYELILASVLVGFISTGLFFYYTSPASMMLSSLKDLVTIVGAYTFGTLLVIFVTIQLSQPLLQKDFSTLELSLAIVPVFLWTAIFVDFYNQRIQGNV